MLPDYLYTDITTIIQMGIRVYLLMRGFSTFKASLYYNSDILYCSYPWARFFYSQSSLPFLVKSMIYNLRYISYTICIAHVHTCTHIHTYIHTHTHTYAHIHTHTYTYTYIHTYTYTHTHTNTYTHIHT